MAKKRKTYVGRWMYLSPCKRFYEARSGRSLACGEGVVRWFRIIGIPTPVKRFRVHVVPRENGDWEMRNESCAYAWGMLVPVYRVGLAVGSVPVGLYEVTVEYEEV